MNLWETVTGSDLTRDCKAFEARAEVLPPSGEGARSYRDRWREQVNRNVARKLGRLGG